MNTTTFPVIFSSLSHGLSFNDRGDYSTRAHKLNTPAFIIFSLISPCLDALNLAFSSHPVKSIISITSLAICTYSTFRIFSYATSEISKKVEKTISGNFPDLQDSAKKATLTAYQKYLSVNNENFSVKKKSHDDMDFITKRVVESSKFALANMRLLGCIPIPNRLQRLILKELEKECNQPNLDYKRSKKGEILSYFFPIRKKDID